jgi:hypothetical protein
MTGEDATIDKAGKAASELKECRDRPQLEKRKRPSAARAAQAARSEPKANGES